MKALGFVVLCIVLALSHAVVRPCGEFGIVCDCQWICAHGTVMGDVCESEYFKAEICATGSVVVDPWLANAIQTQINATADQPLNFGVMFSTHNSFISKAFGYGVGEDQLTSLLKIVDPRSYVRIADQQISVYDQMVLGIRHIEVDTHWFSDDIRIGHWYANLFLSSDSS